MKDADAGGIPHDLRSIAVEFDLMNPSVALGRLLDQGRQQRLYEGQLAAAGRLTHLRIPRHANFVGCWGGSGLLGNIETMSRR